jgi:hypothetical protein
LAQIAHIEPNPVWIDDIYTPLLYLYSFHEIQFYSKNILEYEKSRLFIWSIGEIIFYLLAENEMIDII